jgi:hypothetical protein
MKAWIRCNREEVLAEMTGDESCEPLAVLWEAVFKTMRPKSIAGWYHDCGLLS